MVYEINHEKLKKIIKLYFKHRKAFFVWGRIGIGKSEIYNKTSQEISKEYFDKREYVEWGKTTNEQKEAIINNLEKYFIFFDERLAENDSSDIKGLIDFSDKRDYTTWKIPLFAKIMTNPKSAGVLMLDEINLAPPLVMSSAYKIVYDRIVGNSYINGNWGIFGAGNLEEDGCYTHRISPALADRGGEVILLPPSIEEWTNYAIKNGVESRIIGFLNFKSSNLFKIQPEGEKLKNSTPRGWVRVSDMIKGVTDLEEVYDIACCNISEGIAGEFKAYLKISEKIKIEELIKNPEKWKEFNNPSDLGIRWFITTALADAYKEGKAKFKDIMNVAEVMIETKNQEFGSLMMRLCLIYKPEFEQEFLKGNTTKIADIYNKLLRA